MMSYGTISQPLRHRSVISPWHIMEWNGMKWKRKETCLNFVTVLPAKSDCRESPEGSSNATTSDEMDPAVYVDSALTQDGGCVRQRVQKAGLSAISACRHSEEE